ncbi:uncharacterized protein LOC129596094 [Paramacrobiotus metropolitanus]|uniref:uncharacterized protein LOC129596094 n=1 Tax=Paramacrobiotus metropolitanus TaxID=2943436 RepID=UPI0024462890|nr:uncharacterized protein LOC129596094 [Paramacrobiotus metropolitanus]
MASCGTAPNPDCRSFAAGDLVLSCDPFVWALESSAYKTRCAYCLQDSQELRLCSGCKLHRYCSFACQAADWKLEHKLECGMLKDLRTELDMETAPAPVVNHNYPIPVVLVPKMINKISCSTMVDVPGKGRHSAQEFVEKILPQDPLRLEKERQFQPMSSPALKPEVGPAEMDTLPYEKAVVDNARPMFHTISSNAPIGFAVYPVTPRHHMTPVCWDVNVVINFRGRRMFIHATEDIPVYTGLKDLRFSGIRQQYFLTRDRRRAFFEKMHGFPCTCRKCTEEYDAEINPLKCVTAGCSNRIPSDERALDPCTACGAVNGKRLKEFRRFVQRHQAMPPNSPTDPRTLALCQQLDAAGILQPDAHFRLVCGWELPRKYFNEDRFEEGWKMMQEMIQCVLAIYPQYEEYRAVLLTLAATSATFALEKHVLDGIEKLSVSEKKRRATLSTAGFGVICDYCLKAINIMIVIYGEASHEVKTAVDLCEHIMNYAPIVTDKLAS